MAVETHPEEGWHLRTGELARAMAHGKYWRWSTWGVTALLGVSLLGNIVLGAQPKWKPYYVEIDSCGGSVRVVGDAPELVTLPQLALNRTLATFIESLRTISTDPEMTKQQWRALEHQVTDKGRFQLVQYEQEYQPLFKQDPVRVENVHVYQRTERTYYVRWNEYVYSAKSPKRERISSAVYGGLLTFERRDPRTALERQHAPLGLFFDTWAWQKEQ